MFRKKANNEEKIRRFSHYRITEHWIHILTFLILVLTGLSQRFFYLDVSQWLILKLGGIDNARLLHRYTGMVLSFMVVLHMSAAIYGVVLRRWQLSMVITKKDFSDAICNIKYYVGIGDCSAACDRYSYKQKFEYWGILLGVIIMTITGLMLWHPTIATQFLPGETIPAAKALHSNQALLILLIIAIWHINNAIFSPEVFPLDTSIFTGYISKERMMREHPLELVRMETVETDELPAYDDTEYKVNA